MDKKEYIELMRKRAVGGAECVSYKNIICQPVGLELWFDKKGEAHYSAQLIEKAGRLITASLNEVERSDG